MKQLSGLYFQYLGSCISSPDCYQDVEVSIACAYNLYLLPLFHVCHIEIPFHTHLLLPSCAFLHRLVVPASAALQITFLSKSQAWLHTGSSSVLHEIIWAPRCAGNGFTSLLMGGTFLKKGWADSSGACKGTIR